MRTAEVSRNLAHRSWLAVGQQIERGDLREGEFARCKLLRRRQHQFAPESADGNDSPTDLTETLPATRYLVEGALPHLATGDTHRGWKAAAQPFGDLRDLSNSVTARCMHMRIQ